MKLNSIKKVNYAEVLIGKTWKVKDIETIIHLSENGRGYIMANSAKKIDYRIKNDRLYFTYSALPEYGELHETLEYTNNTIYLSGEEIEEILPN